MTINVKNIFCIGRNYREHGQEVNNVVPAYPLLFTKTTHALVEANGQEIFLPGDKGQLLYEVEFVAHIARQYEPGIKLEDLIDYMTIGIDFTLRDLQNELKVKGYPWELAKAFINSAVISPWQPFMGLKAALEKDFTLEKNGVEVQRGNLKNLILDLPTLFEYTAKHLGLGKDDIFFTGTPAGVGPVGDGDRLVCKWGEQEVGSFIVRLS
ncbi:MAG TPA: fumarylacetoacetate hydrolase family protein [Peptococcaceae bacterium]|nr:fumarylacetoacetate hydrolase family protein [Peptococcaceae bacterium]